MEIWKPVLGYESIAEVSNTGKVRTLDRISTGNNGKSRKIFGSECSLNFKRRYLNVSFRIPTGKRKWFSVHTLVAIAFVPNPNNLPQVNHKDGDKKNNNDWNLEWSTSEDNCNHAVRTGLTSNEEDHYKVKLTKEQVLAIRQDNRSHREIAKVYNVDKSNITAIKARKTWKYI